jgi:hypothetical protein
MVQADGLHDVEAATVEEEGVVAEQAFELRHHRMFRRNGLGIECSSIQGVQGPLDLRGIHLHRTLLWVGGSVHARRWSCCASHAESGR